MPASPAVLVLFTAVAAALTLILVVAWSNYRSFPRLANVSPASLPRVSVLIAARNEQATIGATVSALLDQDYAGPYEVVVVDDCSTDGTARLALAAACNDPRFRLVRGAPLPEEWAGKPWACHQLSQEATGEILLFTDADVTWEPGAIRAVLAEQQKTQAGLLTVWPTQEMHSWAERLVVPLMSFAVLAYLPIRLVHERPEAAAAAANGQCMLFTRDSYVACGGHAAVRSSVLEDVLLARRVKASGNALRMADGAGFIRARMYIGWNQVRDGFAKNILAGHLNSVVFLALSTLAHLALFVLPWIWLVTGTPVSRPLAVCLVAGGVGARALTAATAGQPRLDAFLMPVSVLLMTRIAAQSVWWKWRFGGPIWKGRTLPSPQAK